MIIEEILNDEKVHDVPVIRSKVGHFDGVESHQLRQDRGSHGGTVHVSEIRRGYVDENLPKH